MSWWANPPANCPLRSNLKVNTSDSYSTAWIAKPSLAQTSGSSNAWGGKVIEPWVMVERAAWAEPAKASAATAIAALDTTVRKNHLALACSGMATASFGWSVNWWPCGRSAPLGKRPQRRGSPAGRAPRIAKARTMWVMPCTASHLAGERAAHPVDLRPEVPGRGHEPGEPREDERAVRVGDDAVEDDPAAAHGNQIRERPRVARHDERGRRADDAPLGVRRMQDARERDGDLSEVADVGQLRPRLRVDLTHRDAVAVEEVGDRERTLERDVDRDAARGGEPVERELAFDREAVADRGRGGGRACEDKAAEDEGGQKQETHDASLDRGRSRPCQGAV